jgi:hypothetical protein
MANEIWAAIIQAVPILAAAGVGWRGLSTWRTQLREGRQVEHAEQALAAADPMFRTIRFARSRWSQLSDEDAADPKKQEAAIRRMAEENLRRAWSAFLHFEERYALAGLYSDRTERQLDVAAEIGRCLSALDTHAKSMWLFEDVGDKEQSVKAWTAFYGYANPLQQAAPDDIEERLLKADQALRAELGPILLPKARRSGSRWARLRAAWRGE